MPRVLRIAAGLGLAVLIVTCTDRDLSGPRYRSTVALDLRSFRAGGAAPGQALVPVDTIFVKLLPIPSDPAGEVDLIIPVHADTLGDPLVLKLNVPLKESPETFGLYITARGKGITWYTATDTLDISTGAQSGPTLTARYTGVGANVAYIYIGPSDSTVVSGLPVHLYAQANDSFEGTVDSVPVGYRLHDPAMGTITYPTYLAPILLPINLGTSKDSTWLIGETPTHIKDSVRIYITPSSGGGAPAQVFAISGDAQVDTPLAVLPAPLVALVTDTAGIPVANAKVAWARIFGAGSIVGADTTTADNFGFAQLSYKLGPTVGSDSIRASLVGVFAGPAPGVTFSARADTGLALTFDTTSYMMGNGQISNYILVRTRIPVGANLLVQATSSDSAAAQASRIFTGASTVTIFQGDTLGCCFLLTGNARGSAQLIARAPGYQSATASVTVTTPALLSDAFISTYVNTISTPVVLFTGDSLGNYHPSATDLLVSASSSDPTVTHTDSAQQTLPAGSSYVFYYLGGYKGGSDSITFSAPGYTSAVTQVTVDTPAVYVYAPYPGPGVGQSGNTNFLEVPYPLRTPLAVSVASSNPAVLSVPTTVIIPADSFYAYFSSTAHAAGTATISASALGVLAESTITSVYGPGLGVVVSPNVSVGVKTLLTVFAQDTFHYANYQVTAPLTVRFHSSDSTGMVYDSQTVTIPAGDSMASTGVIFNGTGTITMSATAPGYAGDSTSTISAVGPVHVTTAAPTRIRARVTPPQYPDSLRSKGKSSRPGTPSSTTGASRRPGAGPPMRPPFPGSKRPAAPPPH